MKLSVVSTLYRSKPFLGRFVTEITRVVEQLGIAADDYELLFVNDGSPDDSLGFLLEQKVHVPQIKLIDLSRNFGHHYAMQVGLEYAQGDFIFLIDNDLETPPDFLARCYEVITQEPYPDVVYGYQEVRKGKAVESLGGKIFWWMINKMSEVKIPKNILTERLMTRHYVDNLLRLGDANLFLGGMMYWTGFEQVGLPVAKTTREGESTYTMKKRLHLMVQAVTSFSGKPLEYLFYAGLTITLFSTLGLLYILFQKIVHGDEIQMGWTSLVAVNMLILGIISTFLGLMGIYIFKIFRQVQNRPNAIVKKIYE